MSLWYYAKENQKRGPVTLEELRALFDTGQLVATDMVMEADAACWRPAAAVPGIGETPTTDGQLVAAAVSSPELMAAGERNKARRQWLLPGLGAALVLLILLWGVSGGKRVEQAPSLNPQNPRLPPGVSGEFGDSVHFHNAMVRGLAFSPDGSLLASACRDKSVKIWDWKTRQHRATIDLKMGASEVAFSPDGQFLATATGAFQLEAPEAVRLVRTTDWRDHVALGENSLGAHGVAFDARGRLLAATRRDGSVRLWEVSSGKVRATFQGAADVAMCVAFSPREDVLVFGGKGGRLFEGSLRLNTHREIGAFRNSIVSLAWSKDGKRLAVGEWLPGEDGSRLARAVLLDGKSYAPLAELPGHPDQVATMAFSDDGRMLATVAMRGNEQGVVYLWNAETGAQLTHWDLRYRVWSVAFHPDNVHLVVGDSKGQIFVIPVP